MPVTTTIAKSFVGWMLIFMILCLVFGLWGLYDLTIDIPHRQQQHDRFVEVQQRLAALNEISTAREAPGQPITDDEFAEYTSLEQAMQQPAPGPTMYSPDEPPTGLHYSNIRHLRAVLDLVVDRGHTVVVIEHNLEVIKIADWIIDLGPEGGDQGGLIVVEGTPERVAKHPTSYPGRFLKDRLAGVAPFTALRQREGAKRC